MLNFGLSEDLNELRPSYSNIYNSGTTAYMPPDFIILIEMRKINFKKLIINKRIHLQLINKLYLSIKSNMSTFTNKESKQDIFKR